jgi:chain length determinant protein EpsF
VSLHQFLLALRARARLFAFILVGVIAAATAVTLILPKAYDATASVLVENVGSRPLGYNQTQADIILSSKVLDRVISELKLKDNSAFREAYASTDGSQSYDAWLADMLIKKVKVDTSQSSVLNIIVRWSDAKFAADAANAFARGYIQASEEIRSAPTKDATAWFDDQLKQLRTNMEQAQARLEDYRRGKGIVASDERMDIENARLSELNTQLLAVQNQASDNTLRSQQARGNVDTMPEIQNNSFIQGMRTDLARSEAALQQMRAEFGPNHPQLQRAVSENQVLRQRLNAEIQRVVGGMTTTVNHSRQRETELKRELESQRAKVIGLRQAKDQIEILTRQADAAQRAYENGVQRALSNRIEARSRQPNVAVLNEAVEPTIPARPKFLLNIVLSVVVGMMLAAGMVYFMETVDRRVRSRVEFETYLPVPVLGEIGRWRPDGYLANPGSQPRALPNPG